MIRNRCPSRRGPTRKALGGSSIASVERKPALGRLRAHHFCEVVVAKGKARAKAEALGNSSEAKAKHGKDRHALRSIKYAAVNAGKDSRGNNVQNDNQQ